MSFVQNKKNPTCVIQHGRVAYTSNVSRMLKNVNIQRYVKFLFSSLFKVHGFVYFKFNSHEFVVIKNKAVQNEMHYLTSIIATKSLLIGLAK